MKPLGVTRSQWWVLINASRYGDRGITQTELASVMDLGKVAVGGLIDRLESRGFVERRADSSDRRINRVFLTRKAIGVLEKMNKIALEMNTKVMRGISRQRQHALAQTLHDIKDNLIALETLPNSSANRRKRTNGHPDRRPSPGR
jgi:MarR family transcriptional regulator, transcriptional regulator for hemolysin